MGDWHQDVDCWMGSTTHDARAATDERGTTTRRAVMTLGTIAKSGVGSGFPDGPPRWFGTGNGDVEQMLQSQVRQRCIRSGNVLSKMLQVGLFFGGVLLPPSQLKAAPAGWPVRLSELHLELSARWERAIALP